MRSRGRHEAAHGAFYETASGAMPVREWLLSMPVDDRRTVGVDIAKVEFGWPIGMPFCRPMGAGLFEVRSNLADGRIGRVLFAICGDEMVLLHGFVKKSQATPKPDLELSRRRQKEVQ